jgi:hypothetical protein
VKRPLLRNFALQRAAACCALCWVAIVPSARAADNASKTFALNWVREPGAEGCVSSQVLARMLEQVVGPVLRQPADANVAIEGVVRRIEGGGFRVGIRVTNAEGAILGERELANAAPLCSALTPSLLLVLAIIIDPDAAQRALPSTVVSQLSKDAEAEATAQRQQPPIAPSVDNQPAPSPPKEAAPVSRRPPNQRPPALGHELTPQAARPLEPAGSSSWRFEPFAALLVGTGILPGAHAGPLLGAGLTRPEIGSFSVSGIYWFPTSVDIDSPRALDGDVRFHAIQAIITACRSVIDAGALTLEGCLGTVAGLRWIDAEPLSSRNDPASALFGALLASQLRLTLPAELFVFTGIASAALVPHERFTYEDFEGHEHLIFEAQRISGWASLGVGAKL